MTRSFWIGFSTWMGMLLPLSAQGQSAALTGLMGQRALLVVDASAPKAVVPGESHLGVKLVSIGEGQVTVEVAGKRQTLRLGEAPISVGQRSNESASNRIVLSSGSGGHYVTSGQINGQAARLMVDTGASIVVISAATANQIGLDYKRSPQLRIGTANGSVMAWSVRLDSIRVGEVTVYGVDSVISPEPMPYVLLGNSFLGRFQMKQENDQLTLTRRY